MDHRVKPGDDETRKRIRGRHRARSALTIVDRKELACTCGDVACLSQAPVIASHNQQRFDSDGTPD
jgi:hypothetical protein